MSYLVKSTVGAQLDTSNPLTRGLLMCAPFNENTGTPLDRVQPQTSITRVNGAAWVPYGVSCVPASTYIDFGNPSKLQFSQTSNFTIFVVCSVDGGAGTYRNILRYDPGGVTRALCLLRLSNTNVLEFSYGSTAAVGGAVTGTTAISVNQNKPISIAAVRDTVSDTLKVYQRGVLDASAVDASTGTYSLSGSTWQTRFTTGGEDFNGRIMFTAIWNRALSGAEIALLNENPWRIFVQPKNFDAITFAATENPLVGVSPTSQLGLAQLGLVQLGMIDSGAGPTPPVVVPPDMSTWFRNTEQPIIPFLEVISY